MKFKYKLLINVRRDLPSSYINLRMLEKDPADCARLWHYISSIPDELVVDQRNNWLMPWHSEEHAPEARSWLQCHTCMDSARRTLTIVSRHRQDDNSINLFTMTTQGPPQVTWIKLFARSAGLEDLSLSLTRHHGPGR